MFFCNTRKKLSYRSTRRERLRVARTLMQVSANTAIHKKQTRKTSFKEVQRREFPMKRVRTKVGSVIKSIPQKKTSKKEAETSKTSLQHMTIQEEYSVSFLNESKLSEDTIDTRSDQFALEESSQMEQTSFTISEVSHESCSCIFICYLYIFFFQRCIPFHL